MSNDTLNSYIIPYRKSSDDRERNLSILLDWISFNFNNMEVIIVEMDDKSKIDKKYLTDKKIKHLFIKDDGIFNRSKARNAGALYAEGHVLIFGDNDIVMDPEEFNTCLKECWEEYEAVNPFNIMIDLSEENLNSLIINKKTPFDISKLKMINIHEIKECQRDDLNFAAGISILRKDCFFNIGGWPEEFIGWGGEDDIFSYKVDRFLNNKSHKLFAYHLPHKRFTYDWSNHPEYQSNCDKMNFVLSMSDENFLKYCLEGRYAILNSSYSKMDNDKKNKLLSSPIKKLNANKLQNNNKDDKVNCYPLFLEE